MEKEFWLARWQRGETGWHLPNVHPKLPKCWPQLCVPPSSSVFVPLCGKSHDLLWLAQHHQHVLACDLSELAAQQFFDEAMLSAQIDVVESFKKYSAQNITIFVGDFFKLTREMLKPVSVIYDRAALIALPPALRMKYVAHMKHLIPSANALLITLIYDQVMMNGPPFSVSAEEVAALFQQQTKLSQLLDHEIIELEPRFAAKGLRSLREQVFHLSWPKS